MPQTTQNAPEQQGKEPAFIHLNMRAMQAQKASDLEFVLANETQLLTPYRQAAFFRVRGNGSPYLSCASGLVSVAEGSPYTVWLNHFARRFDPAQDVQRLSLSTTTDESLDEWQEWLPEHLLVVPVKNTGGQLFGYALFAREPEWSETEILQLVHLHKAYGYCLAALSSRRRSLFGWLGGQWQPRYWLIAVAVLAGLLLIPVRLSSLAPAEVVALNAFSVASPQDGVIQSFAVQPNAQVKKGDVLFALDDTSVTNRFEVASKALASARAEALVAEQRAFDELKGKADLAGALGRVREKEAELASIRSQMARIDIKAERDGIAIFADTNDWVGRPVQTGERILQIADPKDAGLLMWLPVKDALNIDAGAEVKLFLHTKPLEPIGAVLRQTSYQATLSPDNIASYRLKAAFEGSQALPRIGLRGTARISGEWTTLGYFLFRRPIAALREWIGF